MAAVTATGALASAQARQRAGSAPQAQRVAREWQVPRWLERVMVAQEAAAAHRVRQYLSALPEPHLRELGYTQDQITQIKAGSSGAQIG